MTDMDARPKRRFSGSIDFAWNRFAYAFLVAILVNLGIRNEALSLAIGVIVFLILTAIVTVGRRRQDGTADQP